MGELNLEALKSYIGNVNSDEVVKALATVKVDAKEDLAKAIVALDYNTVNSILISAYPDLNTPAYDVDNADNIYEDFNSMVKKLISSSKDNEKLALVTYSFLVELDSYEFFIEYADAIRTDKLDEMIMNFDDEANQKFLLTVYKYETLVNKCDYSDAIAYPFYEAKKYDMAFEINEFVINYFKNVKDLVAIENDLETDTKVQAQYYNGLMILDKKVDKKIDEGFNLLLTSALDAYIYNDANLYLTTHEDEYPIIKLILAIVYGSNVPNNQGVRNGMRNGVLAAEYMKSFNAIKTNKEKKFTFVLNSFVNTKLYKILDDLEAKGKRSDDYKNKEYFEYVKSFSELKEYITLK